MRKYYWWDPGKNAVILVYVFSYAHFNFNQQNILEFIIQLLFEIEIILSHTRTNQITGKTKSETLTKMTQLLTRGYQGFLKLKFS